MTAHDHQLASDLAALDRLDQQPPKPEPVTCAACAHFRPDRFNRIAGLGFCSKFNGYNWPLQARQCRAFEAAHDDHE